MDAVPPKRDALVAQQIYDVDHAYTRCASDSDDESHALDAAARCPRSRDGAHRDYLLYTYANERCDAATGLYMELGNAHVCVLCDTLVLYTNTWSDGTLRTLPSVTEHDFMETVAAGGLFTDAWTCKDQYGRPVSARCDAVWRELREDTRRECARACVEEHTTPSDIITQARSIVRKYRTGQRVYFNVLSTGCLLAVACIRYRPYLYTGECALDAYASRAKSV